MFTVFFPGYRRTPNKRPWAFASYIDLKRAFPPFSSILQNENRTIFDRDIVKNVKKDPAWGFEWWGRGVYWRGAFIGVFTVCPFGGMGGWAGLEKKLNTKMTSPQLTVRHLLLLELVTSEKDFEAGAFLDYVYADLDTVHEGSWEPRDCIARQHIAIVVPAKNRQEHLEHLVHHMHPFLQSQRVKYTIFVVEQVGIEKHLSGFRGLPY